MVKKLITVLGLVLVVALPAKASLITVEKVNTQLNSNNILLDDYWKGVSTSQIVTNNIEVATMLYSGSAHNNTLFKMTINLMHNIDFVFNFYAGLDAGRGAEIYNNDTQLLDLNSNLWWARNWAHSHVIAIENLSFSAGKHEFVVYWAENYNSGGNSFEFSINNGERLTLSSANLSQQLSSVPEPSAILLFLLVIVCMLILRKRR